MIISVFDPATGRILKITSAKTSEQANDLYQHWIAGHWSNDQYRVVNGQPTLLPPRPDQPFSRFNFESGQWETKSINPGRVIRQQRNDALSQVDRVNPVWYSTLSEQQKADLAAFRQALLDVPQQSGFPTQIDWPAKPSWL